MEREDCVDPTSLKARTIIIRITVEAIGVPEMVPVNESSTRPVGRDPEVME